MQQALDPQLKTSTGIVTEDAHRKFYVYDKDNQAIQSPGCEEQRSGLVDDWVDVVCKVAPSEADALIQVLTRLRTDAAFAFAIRLEAERLHDPMEYLSKVELHTLRLSYP